MPGFNQKGPMGQGPMSGRRMGKCTNFGANLNNQNAEAKVGTTDNAPEVFQGRGLGRGRGHRSFGLGQQNRFRGGF